MSIRGKRVKLLTVEKKTETTDEYNQPIVTWSAATALSETDDQGRIYGEEHHKGGDEGIEEGQVLAWHKVLWKIPVIADLNENEYRFTIDSKIYEIETIWPIRRSNLMVKTRQQDNQ